MARKSGLGPQGRAAVERAAAIEFSGAQANPATTSTYSPRSESDPSRLNWLSFSSTRVREAAYGSNVHQLYVRFVKPDGTTVYTYDGVSPQEWHNFRRSASPGKYVNRVLNTKNYHPGLE